MAKREKIAIVFSAGMGDGLQMLPLWRRLHQEGHRLTLFLYSPYFSAEFARSLRLFEEVLDIKAGKSPLPAAFSHLLHYDKAYLDYYSSGPKQSLFACLIAKKVVCNRRKWYLRLLPNLSYQQPLQNGHNILQNLHLAHFSIEKMSGLHYVTDIWQEAEISPEWRQLRDVAPYLVAQISAANRQADYKNWQKANWEWLFGKILQIHTSMRILLIGDANEAEESEQIAANLSAQVVSVAGKTNLCELAFLLKNAKMYLGLDSGPMHLAALLGTPALTLWGPSDPATIGYEVMAPSRYKDVCLRLECHPCLSFIRQNPLLVQHPSQCPSPRCIKEISRETVWSAFQSHWEGIYGI